MQFRTDEEFSVEIRSRRLYYLHNFLHPETDIGQQSISNPYALHPARFHYRISFTISYTSFCSIVADIKKSFAKLKVFYTFAPCDFIMVAKIDKRADLPYQNLCGF